MRQIYQTKVVFIN